MARYVFRSVWTVPADPDRVFAALADADSYPQWWPQVRSGRRIDADSGEVRVRSLLPYDLVLQVHRVREDPVARVLAARLDGDLVGLTTWTVGPENGGTRAVFDEDVEVRKGLLRAPARILRPVLRFNHELMMRSGETGLRRHLSSS